MVNGLIYFLNFKMLVFSIRLSSSLYIEIFHSVMQITQQVYVVEEWNKKTYTEAQAEAYSRSEAEKSLGSLKEEYTRLFEQLKEVTKERNSLDAGLKNAEKQAED